MILVGDFNSAADGSTTKTYHMATQAFSDSWPRVNASDPGFTCCTDITAAALSPTERIDMTRLPRTPFRGAARIHPSAQVPLARIRARLARVERDTANPAWPRRITAEDYRPQLRGQRPGTAR